MRTSPTTSQTAQSIKEQFKRVIVGQEGALEQILVALFSGGHVLLEGVPGIAKTLLVKTLAVLMASDFKRVQFTPDLMPSDILGTHVFDARTTEFHLKKGPIFANFVLADEVNRTPPKTQSALLEAMEERQVTIEGEKMLLPVPFMVFATQNPLEYEGTFPLPEAQLDRFMLKIVMGYPQANEEEEVLRRYHAGFDPHHLENLGLIGVADALVLTKVREEIQKVIMKDVLFHYLVELVSASRKNVHLLVGASPRGAINLLLCAKTLAALRGRDYVIPDDIKEMAFPVLRHRIILRPESEIEGLKPDDVIRSVLEAVEVPR